MIVRELWRYPVKSFAGEPLKSVVAQAGGFEHDRRYALVDHSPNRAGKPLTGRQEALLLSFAAQADGGNVVVRTREGASYPIADSQFLSLLRSQVPQQITIEERQNGEFHDAADILVLNAASVSALEADWQKPVNFLRFRPNMIVEGPDLPAFAETAWTGKRFRAGEAVFEAVHPCERCVMTTIDPQSLEKNPDFLKMIVQKYNGILGMYFRVAQSGRVSVGDEWQSLPITSTEVARR